MDDKTNSKVNLNSVTKRVIQLIHGDLSELNHMLDNGVNPFTLNQKQNDIILKRERCKALLSVLQDTIASENELGFKNSKGKDATNNQRSAVADKIMLMLKNRQFIQTHELAKYLEQTLIGFENPWKDNDEIEVRKRESKSIRKIQKVYQPRKK